MNENLEIFCCYAREDQPLLLRLRTHLAFLEREGSLNIWHDIDISPGAEWEEEINKHLNTAHIILLLISPDFMASEYCYSKEMKLAMERHKRGEASFLFSSISSSFSKEAFLAFGWRIPFLLSMLLVLIGLFIRLKITETPDFERIKKTQAIARVPLANVVGQWRNLKYVLLAAGALLVSGTAFYIYATFSISYGTTVLKIPSSVVLNGTLVGSVVMFIVLPLAGALSDRFGRLPIYLIGAGLTILTAFPNFWLIDTKSTALT